MTKQLTHKLDLTKFTIKPLSTENKAPYWQASALASQLLCNR
jgi:hypothetical protein